MSSFNAIIEVDNHSPFVVFGNPSRVFRPVRSNQAPGVDVKAFNKIRQAVGHTEFHIGQVYSVSPAFKMVSDERGDVRESYMVLYVQKSEQYPTGRRELWCCHGDPLGGGWDELDVQPDFTPTPVSQRNIWKFLPRFRRWAERTGVIGDGRE